jgi:hypothetical protein
MRAHIRNALDSLQPAMKTAEQECPVFNVFDAIVSNRKDQSHGEALARLQIASQLAAFL